MRVCRLGRFSGRSLVRLYTAVAVLKERDQSIFEVEVGSGIFPFESLTACSSVQPEWRAALQLRQKSESKGKA